ncbi:MAG: hypothetical protein ACT4OF_04320 [Caulobacteraceae bacterium]
MMWQLMWGNRFSIAMLGGSAASAAIIAAAVTILNLPYASTFPVWLSMGFAANVLVAGTIGLAWHSYAYNRGWRSVWFYVLAAWAVGFAIPLALFAVPALINGEFFGTALPFLSMIACLIGGSLAMLTALFAWLIRRPDRDPQPNPPTSSP